MSYEATLTAPLDEAEGTAWLSARPARVRYPTRIRIEDECVDIVGGLTGETGPGEVSIARGVMSSGSGRPSRWRPGQASAHSDLNVLPPYIVVYMWKRTA